MTRPATEKDIPTLVEMGKMFYEYAELESKGFGFRGDDLGMFMKNLIGNEIMCLLVACDGNKIVGSIGGVVFPCFWDFRQKMIIEQWWWVNPESRGGEHAKNLIDSFIGWGKEMGASRVVMVSLGSKKENAVKRYYQMNGFKYLETQFYKEI